MRVSLSHARKQPPGGVSQTVAPLLVEAGARVILGQLQTARGIVEPIRPASNTLFEPRGATLSTAKGPLFVSDTGHHRLLIWNVAPDHDSAAADLVIGQPDFNSEGRNGRNAVGPATLNVPTGIAAQGDVLAVADAWNHRILIWHGYPVRSNQPADVVLGQADFTSGIANRGSTSPAANTLNWCYGVAIVDGALYVADTGNRRVLRWNQIPSANATPADMVLGQRDFDTRDENAGHAPGPSGMRWPHGVAATKDHLFVADAGNNRIMVWAASPAHNGAPCDFVLGQQGPDGVDHNQAAYYPTPTALNMPYGLGLTSGQLVAADTANCRLIGYSCKELAMNAPALTVAGQRSFQDKGENRWALPERNSLCWPYGVAITGNTCVIADSGNNRVLLWEVAA